MSAAMKITVTGEVEATADELWSVVADFGDVSWMMGVTRCEVEGDGPGMVRAIYAGGDTAVREELEFIDGDQRRLGYTIGENLPLPVTEYHAVMTVRDLGSGRSELDWSCTARPAGVSEQAARTAVEQMYGVLLGWVKAHAEK